MTVLEEAKAHLATYGAAHVECCGTPMVRKLVAEVERQQKYLQAMCVHSGRIHRGDTSHCPVCNTIWQR